MTAQETEAARKIPLAGQADEAHEALTLYYRSLSARVKRGDITASEKDFHIARMRAIRDTLRLFAEFETQIREALAAALRAKRMKAEADELREDPEVSAICDAFPDAEMSITDTTPHQEALL